MKNIPALIASFTLAIASTAQTWDQLPGRPPIPKNNPMTAAKIELGKHLYFDKRLSKTNEIACNSCHGVQNAGSGVDNAQFSTGINGQKGGRNAPTVWNSAYSSVQFWDGRADSLEAQAKGPLTNPVEMGMKDHDEVIKKVAAIPGYVQKFKEVFPGKDSLTIDHLADAIAAYERTLITPRSPYDRFLKGDKRALSTAAQRGMKVVEKTGCLSCHSGPMFNGPTMPAGQGFYMKFPTIPGTEYDQKYAFSKDLGRYEVTHSDADKNTWRIPTWRNVALTAPYFHNGSVATLDEAVRVMAKTQLGKTLPENEVADVVEFLKSLTGERPAQSAPKTLN